MTTRTEMPHSITTTYGPNGTETHTCTKCGLTLHGRFGHNTHTGAFTAAHATIIEGENQ